MEWNKPHGIRASAVAWLVLALAPASATAAPFELIVPTEVNVNGSGGFGINFTAWGLVSPTSGTLTDADLDAATTTVSLSDPNVGVGLPTSVSQGAFSILPGEFAGFLLSFPTTDNSVLGSELLPGETVPALWRYTIGFSFPNTSYTGGGILDTTLTIGGHTVSWSTQVNFLTTGRRFEALSAQRLVSVPEPASLPLVLMGCSLFLWIQRGARRTARASVRRG